MERNNTPGGEQQTSNGHDRDRLERHQSGLDPDDAADRATEASSRQTSPELGRPSTPRIYVASLADYNNGTLHGTWIDADQEPDDIRAEIDAMLAQSSQEVAEDWAIHDYVGFASLRLHEFESLTVVSAVALGIAEHGPAFAAYVSWAGASEEALRAFRHCYMGHYPSLRAYAEEVAEEFGWEAQLRKLSEDMRPYVVFDYDGLARFIDSVMNVVEGDGGVYVFSEP